MYNYIQPYGSLPFIVPSFLSYKIHRFRQRPGGNIQHASSVQIPDAHLAWQEKLAKLIRQEQPLVFNAFTCYAHAWEMGGGGGVWSWWWWWWWGVAGGTPPMLIISFFPPAIPTVVIQVRSAAEGYPGPLAC